MIRVFSPSFSEGMKPHLSFQKVRKVECICCLDDDRVVSFERDNGMPSSTAMMIYDVLKCAANRPS